MSPEGLAEPGALVAVVGPSGAGKDTLIAWARARLGNNPRLVFARRTVTRPADPGAEDHCPLSENGFAAAQAAGAFCLTWDAHGLRYGLAADLPARSAGGLTVVANLSRRVLPEAARLFPRLVLVEITARPELLVARIAARGRESAAQAAARIARRVPLDVPPGCRECVLIDNSDDLAGASDAFAQCLQRIAGSR